MSSRRSYLSLFWAIGFSLSSVSLHAKELRGKVYRPGDVMMDSISPNKEFPIAPEFQSWCSETQTVLGGGVSTKELPPSYQTIYEVAMTTASIPPIRFEKAKFNIQPEYLEQLRQTVESFKNRPDLKNVRLRVVGHTDNDPIIGNLKKTIPDNWVLSQNRAKMVAEAISKELNIPLSEMIIQGKADTVPLATNDTVEGKALNRRVEVKILFDKSILVSNKPYEVEEPVFVPRAGCDSTPAQPNAKGYRITVDGVPVEGDIGTTQVDRERCVDVNLAGMDITIQADDFNQNPILNLTAFPDHASVGNAVLFNAYWNYSAWIERAEIRLFSKNEPVTGSPIEVLSFYPNWQVQWTPGEIHQPEIKYVLRVYDGKGRFDETEPKTLSIDQTSKPIADLNSLPRETLIGYGKNHLAIHNIPVYGAMVTVHGERIPAEGRVKVFGKEVPLDRDEKFVTQEILPPGSHDVPINIVFPESAKLRDLDYHRTIYVADRDWFYIALADLIVGENNSKGPAKLVTADSHHYNDKTYVDGRLAFYLKGKIKGKYLLTASADTREQPVHQMFKNFESKDTRYILRRLDPDRYYPVYGDDSTLVEDAPTQGKFYVRVERGESYILWGNAQTRMMRNELAQVDRAVYGAKLHAVREKSTSFGEPKTQLEAFAAKPDTLHAREEFRGTGGSVYYLRHQDIVIGSERLRVEIRDRDSLIVLKTINLSPNQDYDIDPLQGRIVLNQALPGVADDSRLVRSPELAGNPVFLVARYEYAPLFSKFNDMAVGAQISQWFGDHLELGVTSSRQRQAVSGDQDLLGADLTLRKTASTYLKTQVAQTEGPGSTEIRSSDGGFAFSQIDQDRRPNVKAQAIRVESAFQLADIFTEVWKTQGNAYYQLKEAGFSAPGQLTTLETQQWGGVLRQPLSKSTQLNTKFDELKEIRGQDRKALDLDLTQALSRHWSAKIGSRSEWREGVVASTRSSTTDLGSRTDLAGQLTYDSGRDWKLYGFGQGTVKDSKQLQNNKRGGLGGAYKWSDRLDLSAEGSAGQGLWTGKVGSDFRVSDRTSLYTNYLMESNRDGESRRRRNGTLVTGGRERFNDKVSVFGEERWQHGDGPAGITHVYGTDYSPTDRWQFGLTGEHGEIRYPGSSDMNRTGGSMSASYNDQEKTKYSGTVQARSEKSEGKRRTSYFFRNDLGIQMTPAWRGLAKLGVGISNSSEGDYYKADFTEGVLGMGYRPVDNDRWNTLGKYTFFKDLASPGQLTSAGSIPDFQQRSHIFALDTTYDLFAPLSIGGKYALRLSQLRPSRTGGGPWFSSTAHLGILRLDFHVVRHWDFLLEGRTLHVVEAEDTRSGVLLGVYRHVGKHVKFGGGYNFTDYSDDLTDLSYSSRGWFINILGEF